MPEVVVLSPADAALLREVIQWAKSRRFNTQGRPSHGAISHEEMQAPDVYVARTPRGGIPASTINFTATGTGTGSDLVEGPMASAECVIYRADTGGMVPAIVSQSFTQRVYNLSDVKVPQFKFVLVKRDKWGTWWVIPPQQEQVFDEEGPIYRYFCIGGILKEYVQNSEGDLAFFRSVGCCDCPGTGTGTVVGCQLCPSPWPTLCLTVIAEPTNLNVFPHEPCTEGKAPKKFTLTFMGSQGGVEQIWCGLSHGTDGRLYKAYAVLVCGVGWGVGIGVNDVNRVPCENSLLGIWDYPIYGASNLKVPFCTLPSGPFEIDGCGIGGIATTPGSATLTVGACPADTGTGTGPTTGPCRIQCIGGIIWNVISNGCANPADCAACAAAETTPCTDGAIKELNCDCTPAGGTTTDKCPTVCDSSCFATLADGIGIFAGLDTTNYEIHYDNTPPAGFFGTNVTLTCGKVGRFAASCIDGVWYGGFEEGHHVFTCPVTEGSCKATFNIVLPADNGACPGQTGSITFSFDCTLHP